MKKRYFKDNSDLAPGSDPRRGGAARAEEDRLLRRARAGDPESLRLLLGRVSGPAFRFGMNFCRDREDAEEIAQDVLASLVRSLSSYRGEASLSTWAYTVARNACLRRRRRVDTPLDSLDAWREERGAEPADPSPGPDARLERRQLREAVEEAIRALPPPLREAIVLRDVEGLSAREASRVTRLGERAFKSRLHRARLRLRRVLEPVLRPPADGAPAAAGAARVGNDEARLPRRCPDMARYLSRHLEGDVDPALCARLEAHARVCPSCAALCRSLRTTLRACAALRRKALPPGARVALRGALRRVGTQYGTTA